MDVDGGTCGRVRPMCHIIPIHMIYAFSMEIIHSSLAFAAPICGCWLDVYEIFVGEQEKGRAI